MPQLLALEWDTTEARVALASGRGEQAVVEQAFTVELRSRQPGGDRAEVDIGARLAAALAARGIGKLDALVAIGRPNIELRQLGLPPAPDVELPDLVRFQAMREFNELDDDWLLDFMPLTDEPDQPRTVLAAAIGPEWIEQIQKVCSAAGVRPRRLILRACAAAAHLTRMQPQRQNELRLLVDLLSDEADLTVISGTRVVFLRTMRFSGDPSGVQVLLGEIRRTMAAVQNRLGGRKVDSVVFCGRQPLHDELARRIEADLEIPPERFDPFAGLNWGWELREGLPEHPDRFMPLLGMLLTELEQRPHAVDFLHPRRRPPQPRKGKWYVLAAAAAVVLLIALLGIRHWQRNFLTRELGRLTQQSKDLDQEMEQANQVRKAAARIKEWADADVVWLDALYALSKKFPDAQEAMLTKLTLSTHRQDLPGGKMTMEGLVQSLKVLHKMEEKLRKGDQEVKAGSSYEDVSKMPYSLRFTDSLILRSPPAAPIK